MNTLSFYWNPGSAPLPSLKKLFLTSRNYTTQKITGLFVCVKSSIAYQLKGVEV